MSISHGERLAFTEEDLAGLPSSFPPCLIRNGRIARDDGLSLEWEQYDLLGEGFPATLTEDGELQILLRPTPARPTKAKNLMQLVDYYLSCQPGGETYLGPELRVRPYRSLVPDMMYFRQTFREPISPPWQETKLAALPERD